MPFRLQVGSKLILHPVPELLLEDGSMLTREGNSLVGDLAQIDAIAQQLVDRAAREAPSTRGAATLTQPRLADDTSLLKVPLQLRHATEPQVGP